MKFIQCALHLLNCRRYVVLKLRVVNGHNIRIADVQRDCHISSCSNYLFQLFVLIRSVVLVRRSGMDVQVGTLTMLQVWANKIVLEQPLFIRT